jgi:hypothetical protein
MQLLSILSLTHLLLRMTLMPVLPCLPFAIDLSPLCTTFSVETEQT